MSLLESRRWMAMLSLGILLLAARPLPAQLDLQSLSGGPFGGLGDGPPKVQVEASFTSASEGQPAMLFITADVAPTFHVYSITQKPGGPAPSKIELDTSPTYRVTGAFRASEAPKVHFEQKIWPDLPLEEHYGRVTWYAPIELAAGTDPQSLQITGKLDTQACDPNSCIPLLLPFTATLVAEPPIAIESAPSAAQPTAGAVGEYRPEEASVALRGQLSQATVTPGSTVQLVLQTMPDAGWHVYAHASRDPEIIGKGKPTLIALEQVGPLTFSSAVASAPIQEKESTLEGVGTEKYHEGEVTWTIDLQVPADAAPGSHTITGLMGYQACFDNGCKPPMGVRFSAMLTVGAADGVSEPVPLAFERVSYRAVAKAAETSSLLPATEATAETSAGGETLSAMLLFGFLGGIVLNLMPCVLPVIGLKIMSFVEQSGHSRREALALNLWYSFGLISVFLVLATMAVVLGLTWGEQFGHDGFNITLAVVVFAMGLSLLGVWELPIPGFVGGAKAHEISSKEGPFGAFIKGVITTVLATPCTGPFMGTALAWAVRQPPTHTYAVFAAIGLGMASPYLVIGAYPPLIRFLPKPGAWMATFKQVMGFVLMGTVIFLLTFIDYALIVPTVMLLTGVGVACWWISRTPLTADWGPQVRAWVTGIAFSAVIGYAAFAQVVGTLPGWGAVPGLYGVMEYRLNKYIAQHQGGALQNEEGGIPWQHFTPTKLTKLQQQRKTVLVDFTADWCLICKTLEQTVLNTEEVIGALKQNGVETLMADYTKRPPEIKEMLAELKSNGVPVLAIYPAGRPNDPIVFRGAYTQAAVLDALKQAGPSQAASLETTAALAR